MIQPFDHRYGQRPTNLKSVNDPLYPNFQSCDKLVRVRTTALSDTRATFVVGKAHKEQIVPNNFPRK